MNRILALAAVLAMLIVWPACSSKKPPEQAAVKSKNVLSVLRSMNKAYEQKDLDTFMSDVSTSFPDRTAFAKSLTEVFAKYETIHFNIQYARMLILIEDKGAIRTTFTWDAEWLSPKGGALKDGGRVTLVFDPGSYKLISVDGKNPFPAQPGVTPEHKP
jgi:hypothetical protein